MLTAAICSSTSSRTAPRQLSIESELTHEPLEEKPVTLAIREVAAGQLKAELDDKYRH